jgi:hypothetical protein
MASSSGTVYKEQYDGPTQVSQVDAHDGFHRKTVGNRSNQEQANNITV